MFATSEDAVFCQEELPQPASKKILIHVPGSSVISQDLGYEQIQPGLRRSPMSMSPNLRVLGICPMPGLSTPSRTTQYAVQPQLSGLLATTQMSSDNRGPAKYSLL